MNVDRFAVSTLFYNILQGNLVCHTLKLKGGYTDESLSKILHLSGKLKELIVNSPIITDELNINLTKYMEKSFNL